MNANSNTTLWKIRTKRWRRAALAFAAIGIFMLGIGVVITADPNLKALAFMASVFLITVAMLFGARTLRCLNFERTINLLEPIRSELSQNLVTFSIPIISVMSPSTDELLMIESIAGREVIIDGDELKVFYGFDISGFTKPIRTELRKSGNPYLVISIKGITEFTIRMGTSGRFATPPNFQIYCDRRSLTLGENAITQFNPLLSSNFETEISALPILIMLKREYFSGFESNFLEALRYRLKVPIAVESYAWRK